MTDIGSVIVSRWNRARGSRFGRWLFSRGLGRFAPYTGTIAPRVRALEPGHAVVAMRDRKVVRNHVRSVHAAALTNLLELTGSLAVLTALQPESRMIPVRLEIEFVKKARGELTATARRDLFTPDFQGEATADVSIVDEQGDVVARGAVTVTVGPAS